MSSHYSKKELEKILRSLRGAIIVARREGTTIELLRWKCDGNTPFRQVNIGSTYSLVDFIEKLIQEKFIKFVPYEPEKKLNERVTVEGQYVLVDVSLLTADRKTTLRAIRNE